MRIDERDIMFSRMVRKEGTASYEAYYKLHPEYKEKDDEIRKMPGLGSEGTATFDPFNSPMVDTAFNFLADIKHLVSGPAINKDRLEIKPQILTSKIKGLAHHYGAALVGITPRDENHYYSHRGRMDENFGDIIEPKSPFTIVFGVEMDKQLIDTAPHIPQSLAVTKGYVDTAIIGMILTYYIKSLGYDARNHMDGNYLMVLPLAAKSAGLGDLGRHGLLITEEYGSRIRLGAVTTDIPLVIDKPSSFNVTKFCETCGKCAKTCPGKAISHENLINGLDRWQIIQEECYKKWRILGTDCGICVSTCPFSSNIPKNLIDAYKNNPDMAVDLLKRHEKNYPIRPFIKEMPSWLKS